jgi:hypothetical protein
VAIPYRVVRVNQGSLSDAMAMFDGRSPHW